MNGYFFSFAKRKNSTKRPLLSDAAFTLSVNINDGRSSVLTPAIRVTPPTARQTMPNFIHQTNYCYLEGGFNRYYYVTNWEYNADGTWTGFCEVDALASWRTEIINSGGYCERSEVDWDGLIPDTIYKASNRSLMIKKVGDTGFRPLLSDGTFIVGIIGSYGVPTVGTTTYFIVTPVEMGKLLSSICITGNDDWYIDQQHGSVRPTDTNLFTTGLLTSMVNPIQYIVSCKWFPCTITSTGQEEDIYLYAWKSGAKGKPLGVTSLPYPSPESGHEYKEITIPDLSDVVQTGLDASYLPINGDNYPAFAPYASYDLITPWGTWELDATKISEYLYLNGYMPKLKYAITVNFVSGDGILKVLMDDSKNTPYELFRKTVTIAHDIPIAQTNYDSIGLLESTVHNVTKQAGTVGDTVFGMIAGGGMSQGMMGGMMQGISDTFDTIITPIKYALSPSVQSGGSPNSVFTPEISSITIQSRRFKTVGRAPNLLGKPCYKYMDSLPYVSATGDPCYVKMAITTFAANCLDSEKSQIIGHLMGGMFLE